jgi:hypothetical protein
VPGRSTLSPHPIATTAATTKPSLFILYPL